MEEPNFLGTSERRKDSRAVPSINFALKLLMVIEKYMNSSITGKQKECTKRQWVWLQMVQGKDLVFRQSKNT